MARDGRPARSKRPNSSSANFSPLSPKRLPGDPDAAKEEVYAATEGAAADVVDVDASDVEEATTALAKTWRGRARRRQAAKEGVFVPVVKPSLFESCGRSSSTLRCLSAVAGFLMLVHGSRMLVTADGESDQGQPSARLSSSQAEAHPTHHVGHTQKVGVHPTAGPGAGL
eukprot:3041418-Prymnesium_polylepis.1